MNLTQSVSARSVVFILCLLGLIFIYTLVSPDVAVIVVVLFSVNLVTKAFAHWQIGQGFFHGLLFLSSDQFDPWESFREVQARTMVRRAVYNIFVSLSLLSMYFATHNPEWIFFSLIGVFFFGIVCMLPVWPFSGPQILQASTPAIQLSLAALVGTGSAIFTCLADNARVFTTLICILTILSIFKTVMQDKHDKARDDNHSLSRFAQYIWFTTWLLILGGSVLCVGLQCYWLHKIPNEIIRHLESLNS